MNSDPQPTISPRPTRKWRTRTLVWIGVALLLAWWLGLLRWALNPVGEAVHDAWYCATSDCDPSGPAVSWNEQLATAEKEAHKADPNAILREIAAYPAAYNYLTHPFDWNPNKVLEVRFDYALNSDDHLDITFW